MRSTRWFCLAVALSAGCSLVNGQVSFDGGTDPGVDAGDAGASEDSGMNEDGGSDGGTPDCVEDEVRPCPGGSEIGECDPGTQICVDGAWSDCMGQIGPTDEICDGLDNDCDNVIDGLHASLSCGANAACDMGTCRASTCPGGMGDCDGDIGNGCETDVTSSVEHCGVCGNACVWACEAGACDDPASLSDGRGQCVLRRSGGVACFGSNHRGQLGDGTFIDSDVPVDVVGFNGIGTLSDVTQVAVGARFVCARHADSTATCWGENREGQLSIPSSRSNRSSTPIAVSQLNGTPLGSIASVAAGDAVACALMANSTMRCWGKAARFRPAASSTEETHPVIISMGTTALSNITQIAIGRVHTCILQGDGTVRCWGTNQYGQLGTGGALTGAYDYSRSSVSDLSPTAIAAGDDHTCALLDSGTVKCWGNNASGQIGDGGMVIRSTPASVSGITDAVAISASYATSCALHGDGRVSCWGSVRGATEPAPVLIDGMTGIEELSIPCGRRVDGTVLCWTDDTVDVLPAP